MMRNVMILEQFLLLIYCVRSPSKSNIARVVSRTLHIPQVLLGNGDVASFPYNREG